MYLNCKNECTLGQQVRITEAMTGGQGLAPAEQEDVDDWLAKGESCNLGNLL